MNKPKLFDYISNKLSPEEASSEVESTLCRFQHLSLSKEKTNIQSTNKEDNSETENNVAETSKRYYFHSKILIF